MQRVRIRELALVAVAGGLLAFEVIGLRGALPVAMEALAHHGIIAEAQTASAGAAEAIVSAGPSATRAAVDMMKEAARIVGDVRPRGDSDHRVLVASEALGRDARRHLRLVTVTADGRCVCTKSVRRVRSAETALRVEEARRAAESALRRATL